MEDPFSLENWTKTCVKCGRTFDLFNFRPASANHQFSKSDTCKGCEKKVPLRQKKSRGRNSIAHYGEMRSDWMTADEIKWHYKELKKHMYIKYGTWCDETIHKTILKGFHYSKNWRRERGSKLVFLQIILWSIWIDSEQIRKRGDEMTLQIDWTYSADGATLADYIEGDKPDFDINMEDFVMWIREFLGGKEEFRQLWMMMTGATPEVIAEELGLTRSEFMKGVKEQREEFRKVIPVRFQHLLSDRVPIMKRRPSGIEYKKE